MSNYHQQLTNEDEVVFYDRCFGNGDPGSKAYEYRITDRNDYAVMLGLMAMSNLGCRATKNRFLASSQE